jgi:hypothetical protein
MLLFTKIYNICSQIDKGCITPYTTLLLWFSDWQFTRVCRSGTSCREDVLRVVFVADVGDAILRFPLDGQFCECFACCHIFVISDQFSKSRTRTSRIFLCLVTPLSRFSVSSLACTEYVQFEL